MEEIQTIDSSVLKLVKIEGKGRGLLASQPLKGGQIIMKDSPIYAYIVSPLKLVHEQDDTQWSSSCPRFCAHCYRSLESLEGSIPFTCSSCSDSKDSIFCSSKCQFMAFSSSHTPWVCQTLGYLRNCSLLVDHQTPDHELEIQARCLVTVFNLAMVFPSKFQAFFTLDGCGVRDGERYVNAATSLHSILSRVSFPEGSSFSLPSVGIIADILAKDWRNSFCLMGSCSGVMGRKIVRGYAVYLNASLFNHSCLPNACHFNYLETHGGSANRIIRLTRDVQQGEEICISYLRANMSYSERQKRLMNDYNFACVCDRCKVEANETNCKGADNLETFMCKQENCRGFLAPLPPSVDGCWSEFMECNYCGNLTKRQDEM